MLPSLNKKSEVLQQQQRGISTNKDVLVHAHVSQTGKDIRSRKTSTNKQRVILKPTAIVTYE
jgi:hypothetical protein